MKAYLSVTWKSGEKACYLNLFWHAIHRIIIIIVLPPLCSHIHYSEPIIWAHNYSCPGSAMLLVQMKSCLIKSYNAVCCDECMQLGQRGCERIKNKTSGGKKRWGEQGRDGGKATAMTGKHRFVTCLDQIQLHLGRSVCAESIWAWISPI